jgi:hypothetical protein
VQWRLESANPIQQGFTQANRSRRISPTISMLRERTASAEYYAHDTTGYGVVSVGLSQAGRTLIHAGMKIHGSGCYHTIV